MPVMNMMKDATAASVGSLECSTDANICTGRVAALPLTRKIESATFPNEVTKEKIAAESSPGKMLGRITRYHTTSRDARRLCAALLEYDIEQAEAGNERANDVRQGEHEMPEEQCSQALPDADQVAEHEKTDAEHNCRNDDGREQERLDRLQARQAISLQGIGRGSAGEKRQDRCD